MSIGMQIALAVWMIVSGCAGFERYRLQGKNFAAHFDGIQSVVGMFWLAHSLNAVLPS